MEAVLRSSALSRSFGPVRAVRDLELEVEEGDICAFPAPASYLILARLAGIFLWWRLVDQTA